MSSPGVTLVSGQPSPSSANSRRTLADLLRDLGDIPADRVLLNPAPGTATEEDLLRLVESQDTLVELIDGTLVEKPVGSHESLLAVAVAAALRAFVIPRNLGLVFGADATLRMMGGNIRLPDVSFVAWEQVPGGTLPPEPVPKLPPTLAVEVLSSSNTPAEMSRKRREYFESGTKLVWEIDPAARSVTVYIADDQQRAHILREEDTLDGGNVLSGFSLPLRELFAELDRRAR